ncbi:MAG: 16S rRNA (guanine(527)-N(7))-methyltransferase RsmG [Pseudomonadota bacterium]
MTVQKELAGVSRETLEALESYLAETLKWTAKINLIAKSSHANAWERHVLDSAQLWNHRPQNAHRWLDLGSGAGFPALVNAIIAKTEAPDLSFACVESDIRKAVFLRKIVTQHRLNACVLDQRIEDLPTQDADVISARALAPLPKLLTLASAHATADATFLLLKGRRYRSELTEARKIWQFDHSAVPSRTDPEAVILIVKGLKRA